jgi:hypothetical protein
VTHPNDLLTISDEPRPDHRAARFPGLVAPTLSVGPVRTPKDELDDALTHLANRSLLVHRPNRPLKNPEKQWRFSSPTSSSSAV